MLNYLSNIPLACNFLAPKTPAPTPTSPPILTSTLGIGSSVIGNDGMTLLYVPAGEFTMGSDDGERDHKPAHKVYLDAFWIDQAEVTNKMYKQCVDANKCDMPTDTSSYTHPNYFGNSEFDNYPVMYVDWNMANAYCSWAGRRLPTEAEWEKAARGTNAFTYPWGNDVPNSNLLNYNDNVGDSTQVGAYPDGASIYGALDMAGNVEEWVSSLYKPYPYNANDGRENLSSPVLRGDLRVVRGGTWLYGGYYARSASRLWDVRTSSDSPIGFRCSR